MFTEVVPDLWEGHLLSMEGKNIMSIIIAV